MGQAVPIKKASKAKMDTILVTPEIVQSWKRPEFQRPIKENRKVVDLAEEMKRDGGVWPGVVTLGIIGRETYLIDGQHRRHSFLISGLKDGLADVRIHYFDSMAEMGEEFVRLNSQLVRLNPDDILRGLEAGTVSLKLIREKCSFVGYDMVRRNTGSAPMLSMSVAIRSWSGSGREVPQLIGSATVQAAVMTVKDTEVMIQFLQMCFVAFGRDAEYHRLWSALNLCLCMWLYRRCVLDEGAHANTRWDNIKQDEFKRCLMALSADRDYSDWLIGRNMGERDRSPCYDRIKRIFIKRMNQERGVKVSLPQPSWSHTRGGGK